MARLSLPNLVAGLEQFQGKYHALDVFIDNVEELVAVLAGQPVAGLESRGPNAFRYEESGRSFDIQLFPELGVARFARAAEAAPGGGSALVGGFLGAAMGAASAKRKNETSEHAAIGLVLGLLVGAALGGANATAPAARRVFALRFDAETQQWRAYDGALVRWMKDQLAHPLVVADIPT